MAASIISMEALQVLNLGTSGALVEAALPLPPNAEYEMQLVVESHVSDVTVKVRRVTSVMRDTGAMGYRIGLEFLTISPEAADVINQIVIENQAQV
jgi:c-di-GMP-binding flagellar brake protein YcgR